LAPFTYQNIILLSKITPNSQVLVSPEPLFSVLHLISLPKIKYACFQHPAARFLIAKAGREANRRHLHSEPFRAIPPTVSAKTHTTTTCLASSIPRWGRSLHSVARRSIYATRRPQSLTTSGTSTIPASCRWQFFPAGILRANNRIPTRVLPRRKSEREGF
jgi:hypothetical protein